MHAKLLQSCLILLNLWTANFQASLSMGFSREENCSGLPCPLPGRPGSVLRLLYLLHWQLDSLLLESPVKSHAYIYVCVCIYIHTHIYTHTHTCYVCMCVKTWPPQLEPYFPEESTEDILGFVLPIFPKVFINLNYIYIGINMLSRVILK